MKVIELYAENVKRIEAVLIKPQGNLVEITGENEQGKTSVLDTLWWAFGGQDEIQSMPIRIGEKKARIDIDLGELKVTRFFNLQEDGGYTTRLEIRNAEGFKASSPQALLDKAVGRLTMDPLAFMKAKPADQAKQLRSLVPGFDFAKNDAEFKQAYDARTETGRQIRLLEAQLVSFRDLPAEIPKWRDPKDLMMKLDTAHHFNAAIDEDLRNREAQKAELAKKQAHIEEIVRQKLALQAEIEEHRQAIAVLEGRIDTGEKLLAEASADCDAFEKKVKTQPAPMQKADTEEIRKEMDQLQIDNALAEKAKARDKLAADVKALQVASNDLTRMLEKRKDDEIKAMKDAKLPVEDLAFSDAGVTIKGHPLDQASASQQLRLSVAVAIAMNPKLRVMRIVDGSLLGRAQMAELETIANEQDYQIWIERVATGEDIGIVIEDGRVKGQVLEKEKPAEEAKSAPASPAGGNKNGDDAQSKPFTLL